MFVVHLSEQHSSVGRNAISKFSPNHVNKSVTAGIRYGIVGEKNFAQALWISANFASVFDGAGRKNIQSFAPALSNQYQQLNATESDRAKFSKTTFRPSPVMVGEKKQQPFRAAFRSAWFRFGQCQIGNLGVPMIRGSCSPTCASGARAELRQECDCGAGARPYRCRLTSETDPSGKRLVVIETDGPLSTVEAGLFALQLLELTRAEGERWAREQMREPKKSKGPEKPQSPVTDRLLAIHLRPDCRIEQTLAQPCDADGEKR